MLAEKIVDTVDKYALVKHSKASFEQYEVATKEVANLAKISHMSWGVMTKDYYNRVVRFTLIEGTVYGLLAGAAAFAGYKIMAKVKAKKAEEA